MTNVAANTSRYRGISFTLPVSSLFLYFMLQPPLPFYCHSQHSSLHVFILFYLLFQLFISSSPSHASKQILLFYTSYTLDKVQVPEKSYAFTLRWEIPED